jgi:hypothetical protein
VSGDRPGEFAILERARSVPLGIESGDVIPMTREAFALELALSKIY